MPSRSAIYSDASLFAMFRQVLRGLDSQSEKMRRKEIKGSRKSKLNEGRSSKTKKTEKFTNPRVSEKKSQSSAKKTKGGPKDTTSSTQVVAKGSPSQIRRKLARAEKFGRNLEADKLSKVISEKKQTKTKKKVTVKRSDDEDFRSGRSFDFKSKKWVPGLRLWTYTSLGEFSMLYQYSNELMDHRFKDLWFDICKPFSGSTLKEEWTTSSKIRASKAYTFKSWTVDKSGKPIQVQRDYLKVSKGLGSKSSGPNWKVFSGICKGAESRKENAKPSPKGSMPSESSKRAFLRKYGVSLRGKRRGKRSTKSSEKKVESDAVKTDAKAEVSPIKVTRRRRFVDFLPKDHKIAFEDGGESSRDRVYVSVPKSLLGSSLSDFTVIENCIPTRLGSGPVRGLTHWSSDESELVSDDSD